VVSCFAEKNILFFMHDNFFTALYDDGTSLIAVAASASAAASVAAAPAITTAIAFAFIAFFSYFDSISNLISN
jgi:hypothetical protein